MIMAGGKGTRFWPLSIEARPKQFVALTAQETMIQQTYRRFAERLPKEKIYAVAPKQYVPLILEQLPELVTQQLIVEPSQRDTAPCIALTAKHFLDEDDDEVLVTVPSDQYIPDTDALMESLSRAARFANKHRNPIVTLGIIPTRPETGYGYIRALETSIEDDVYRVAAFIEKPSMYKAQSLYCQKNIYWNSGIFIWKPSTISTYMEQFQPDLWDTIKRSPKELDEVYTSLPKISVDYAILEKADQVFTIPVDFEWDDLGAWTSLERIHSSDPEGNIILGDIQTVCSANNIISVEKQKTIVIGVQNLIIVSTPHGLLVCHKSNEQDIKQISSSRDEQNGGER